MSGSKPIVAVVGRPNVGKSTFLIRWSAEGFLLSKIPQALQETESMQKQSGTVSTLH